MELFLLISLQVIFWVSVLAIIHSYAVYPFVMRNLARRVRQDQPVYGDDTPEWPRVYVIMAAYNEEAVIEETLQSIASNDYPRDRFEILVGSDGSTDRTNEIIGELQQEYASIRFRNFGGRNGKIRILNQWVEQVRQENEDWEESVFILCDANVTWSPELTKNLVKHFRQDEVGVVASNVLEPRRAASGIAAAEEAYVNNENLTKFAEGALWGRTMGAFGACFAMRASLYQKVPETYIVDDFFLTMACFEQGGKAIVDLDAICYEKVSEEISEEFRRKRRIGTGNFQNLAHFWNLLLPWNGGWNMFFAFWSHKGFRWIGPLFLLAAFASAITLALFLPIYWIPAVGLLLTVLGAGADVLIQRIGSNLCVKPFRFVRYFYAMNGAMFLGMMQFLQGVQNSVWEPTQRPAEASKPS